MGFRIPCSDRYRFSLVIIVLFYDDRMGVRHLLFVHSVTISDHRVAISISFSLCTALCSSMTFVDF